MLTASSLCTQTFLQIINYYLVIQNTEFKHRDTCYAHTICKIYIYLSVKLWVWIIEKGALKDLKMREEDNKKKPNMLIEDIYLYIHIHIHMAV